MTQPKTIDNLGIDSSVRWATDQKLLNQSLVKESPFISKQAAVDVTSPYFENEFDALFQTNKRFTPWALFQSPQGYNHQKMRLFTFQSIPSLGSDELLSTQIQRIQDKLTSSKKKRKKKEPKGSPSEYRWEGERAEEEELKESKTLIALLEYIQLLDSLMAEVNARRSQYQKG